MTRTLWPSLANMSAPALGALMSLWLRTVNVQSADKKFMKSFHLILLEREFKDLTIEKKESRELRRRERVNIVRGSND